MKIFVFSIDEEKYFGEDDDNKDTVKDEIAYRLGISSSSVFVEEVEHIEE